MDERESWVNIGNCSTKSALSALIQLGKKTEKIMKERKPKKDDVGKEKKKQVKKHRKEEL